MNEEKLETYSRAINIPVTDLMSLDHKKEARYVIKTKIFRGKELPTIDLPSVDSSTIDIINPLLKELKEYDRSSFDYIHSYRHKGNGIGPGELMAYCVISKAVLGGAGSAGEDMVILPEKSESYEIKAGTISTSRWVNGFQIGRTLDVAPIIASLHKLRNDLNIPTTGPRIETKPLRAIASARPKEFKAIQEDYKDMAYDLYFSGHKTIFINNAKYSRQGLWEAVKEVKRDDIRIEKVGRSDVFPLVYIGDQPKWEA